MRENTPPHANYEIEDDISDVDDEEFVYFDDFEEITEAELETLPTFDETQQHTKDVVDISILTFAKHTEPVFCCSLHPTKNWAVTGGQDDRAFIWDRETGETIYEINEHRDTVIGAKFSSDGNYLATGDMAGEVFVYKLNGAITKVWENSIGDMTWLKWHRAANVLFAGTEAGEIYIWRIPSGECKLLPGKGSKCETAELTADGKKIFAGYGDGVVKLWDIKNCTSVMEVDSSNPMGHTESVLSVSCDTESSLYASCGEDGNILLSSNSGPVGIMQNELPLEVIVLSPYPDLKVAATGNIFDEICIWDYTKQSLRVRCEDMGDGATSMQWLPDYTLLVGTISGSLVCYDGRNGSMKSVLTGHLSQIYDLCYNQNENIILTASEDGTAKIFKYS